jgi:putative Mn2+ efflux pump MntP
MSMSTFSVLLIAVALAMDAFAVSVSCGIALSRVRIRHALLIASFFGLFQGLMPFAGWHARQGLTHIIADRDHWIAFLLLLAVGVKMVYDAFRSEGSKKNLIRWTEEKVDMAAGILLIGIGFKILPQQTL